MDAPDTSGGAYQVTSSSASSQEPTEPVTESDEATGEAESPAGQKNTQNPMKTIKNWIEQNNEFLTGGASALAILAISWNGIQEVRS